MTVADTTFLIDLQKSRRSERHQIAADWIRSNPQESISIPAIVLGEYAEGFADPDHPSLRRIRAIHSILPVDELVALQFGSVSRFLRSKGKLIGPNDIWIAATALAHEAPLLTRNVAHFTRVPGLRVINYA
ncbi:type II toxin-antitoxin system VapC family toxin [Opitutaceae bacterium]|nr:type II toxin-antitoxin system VapC family toxin [Opitutaceae bacterium]